MDRLALLGGDPVIAAAHALCVHRRGGSGGRQEGHRIGVPVGFYGSPGDQVSRRSGRRAWRPRGAAVPRRAHGFRERRDVWPVRRDGASGVGPGDEVIVPPTTMSATAMAPSRTAAIRSSPTWTLETLLPQSARWRRRRFPPHPRDPGGESIRTPGAASELRALADSRGISSSSRTTPRVRSIWRTVAIAGRSARPSAFSV